MTDDAVARTQRAWGEGSSWAWTLRVLPAAVVLAGGFATQDLIADSARDAYAVWTAAGVAGMLLLATRLKGPFLARVPRWILATVLTLGYFLQVYLMLRNPLDVEKASAVIASSITTTTILAAYGQAVIAVWLVVGVCAFLDNLPRRPPAPPVPPIGTGRATRLTILVTAACLAVTSVPMAVFNVGLVGYAQNLPFRLAGFVLNSHRTLIPGLALTAAMLASGAGQRRWYGVAIALFIAGAVTDTLVTTTRAALLVAAIRFVIFELARGTLSRRHLAVGALIVVAAGSAFPFITRLRLERAGGATAWGEALGAAGEARDEPDADADPVEAALLPVAMRFAGGGALVPIIDHGVQVDTATVVDGLLGGPGITGYTTRQVFGYPSTDAIGIAPSLLGWLFLADGERGQRVGIIVITVLMELLWSLLASSRLLVRPVVLALVGGQLFQVVSEGTLESIGLPAAVTIASAVILEILLRRAARTAHA